VQTGPEAHPASCTMGTGSFPGVSWRPGRDADLSPLLMPRSKIEYSYTSTLPKGLCGLWQGETYLEKFRDSKFGTNSSASCLSIVKVVLKYVWSAGELQYLGGKPMIYIYIYIHTNIPASFCDNMISP